MTSRGTSVVDRAASPAPAAGAAGAAGDTDVNVVRLTGRLSAEPQARQMPSGDEMVQLRVVVPRDERTRRRPADPAGAAGGSGRRRAPQVDTIDVTCWSAVARRGAMRLQVGDVVEVHGALRRRFFRVGSAVQSRYEVEAELVRRLRRPAG